MKVFLETVIQMLLLQHLFNIQFNGLFSLEMQTVLLMRSEKQFPGKQPSVHIFTQRQKDLDLQWEILSKNEEYLD